MITVRRHQGEKTYEVYEYAVQPLLDLVPIWEVCHVRDLVYQSLPRKKPDSIDERRALTIDVHRREVGVFLTSSSREKDWPWLESVGL